MKAYTIILIPAKRIIFERDKIRHAGMRYREKNTAKWYREGSQNLSEFREREREGVGKMFFEILKKNFIYNQLHNNTNNTKKLPRGRGNDK